MQHMLLMISSQAPAGETALEPARTPIRKPGSPNWMMHVASRADGKVLSRCDPALGSSAA